MRPQPQVAARRLRDEGGEQGPAVAARPAGRVHHELPARARDDVGHVEMRVRRQRVALPGEQVAGRPVPAVAQVQLDVLGQRAYPVGLGGGLDEPGHGVDLGPAQLPGDLDA